MKFLKGSRWFLFLLIVSCSGPRGCFPNFSELKTHYPHVIYNSKDKSFKINIEKAPPKGWTPLAKISQQAQWAVVVSEDWAFYQHGGLDTNQIKEALMDGLEEGRIKRGASTITQQVVRNIYLTQRRTFTRKAREAWMAVKIEKALGKKKILELYFNIAEWGEGIFGIGAASQHYFNKSPSELNAKEGAFLAMLLPSPKKYSISFRKKKLTDFSLSVMKSIMDKMVMAKFLTEEERDAAWAQPLSFESYQSSENEGEE